MRLLSYNCDDVICSGCARPVPASVIELVKAANRSLKLGQLLCQCRSPDFLLEVIEKQVLCVSLNLHCVVVTGLLSCVQLIL